MHKNAIKKVRGVKFLEILAKNSCFSRVLGLFCSCFSCFFGSAIVFFKKKHLITLQKPKQITDATPTMDFFYSESKSMDYIYFLESKSSGNFIVMEGTPTVESILFEGAICMKADEIYRHYGLDE